MNGDGTRERPYVVDSDEDEAARRFDPAGGGERPVVLDSDKARAARQKRPAGGGKRPSAPKRAATGTLQDLWSAIHWRDRDRVVELLHALAPRGLLDEKGQSPVHAALLSDTADMLRLVLEHAPPGIANLHGERAPSPLMYALRYMIPQRRAKVQLLVEHGADTDALDEHHKNALEATAQIYRGRIHSIADTLTLMVARGRFTTMTIRATRGVPDKIELMAAVKDMTPNSAQALLEPSCHDPNFLERLAKLYADRITEFGDCAETQRNAVIGSIIGRLQQLPPNTGKFAVFTAELIADRAVLVNTGELNRAAWYSWTPAVMARALGDRDGRRVMPAAPGALGESDFVNAKLFNLYIQLPGFTLKGARLDTSDSAFDAPPAYSKPDNKFNTIGDAKRKAVRTHAFSGQAVVKIFRKGLSHKEYFVVAIFDVALLEAMRTAPIRTIDVAVWLYGSQKTALGAHAMALDVTDQGGTKVLTPFDSNYRGLQKIGHAEDSTFGAGFCQTWSRLHLETVAMRAPDWTKHVLKLYSSGNSDARAEFERLFGDSSYSHGANEAAQGVVEGTGAPRYPVTRFVLCTLLRYRDAQEVAWYRLQARRCIAETRASHSDAFFLWLEDPAAKTDPHRRPLLLRAFAAEVICTLLPDQGFRSIGHYFIAAYISPDALAEDEFDEYVRAYRYETAHPDIPFVWTPGYRIGDLPEEDGERGTDFVRACRGEYVGDLYGLDRATFVSLNARAMNRTTLKLGVAEAVRTDNEVFAIAILLSVKTLGDEMVEEALQSEPTEANVSLVEFLLRQGVRPGEPTSSENPAMRKIVESILDELPLRP